MLIVEPEKQLEGDVMETRQVSLFHQPGRGVKVKPSLYFFYYISELKNGRSNTVSIQRRDAE
jgi:hypothetical protein